jgi:hypothetical protein
MPKTKSIEHIETSLARKLKEPTIEHLYIAGILGNTMSWGDQ